MSLTTAATPPTWQRIEAALETLFRDYGDSLDRQSETGDLITADLNLTELAKDLEAELRT